MSDPMEPSLELAPDGARCALHNDTPATVVCARCGSYCCPDCSVQFNVRYLCRPCFAIERAHASYGEASTTQRVLNFAIDLLCARLLVGIVYMLLLAAGASELLNALGQLVLHISYYVVLEGATGQTLGKLVTHTRVVSENGGKPSWGRIIVRTLTRYVPAEPLSFLIWDRGWHDSWSKTRVVRTIPL